MTLTAADAQRAHTAREDATDNLRALGERIAGRAMTHAETREERDLLDAIHQANTTVRRYLHQENLRAEGFDLENGSAAEIEGLIGTAQRSTTAHGGETRAAGEWLASEVRAITTGDGSLGSSVTPAEHSRRVVDMLAARSVFLRSGVQVLRTDADSLVIPHVLGDGASAWVAEMGTISDSNPTGEPLTATPRKVGALATISNEAVADSNPAVLDVVGRGLIRSLSLRFDIGAYEGSGTSPEVRGLKNVAGIQTVSMGTDGAALTNLDPVAEALGLLEEANSEAGAIVMPARTWRELLKIKEATGSNVPILLGETGPDGTPRRSIYGVPVYVTSQLALNEVQGTATNASSVYVYAPSEVLAVIRQDVKVDLDRSRLFHQDASELRSTFRADVLVPNPKAVVRIQGVIPTA